MVTGNTKKVAEAIASGLRKGKNQCSLVQLTKYEKDLRILQSFPFEKFDLLGFGVPVYYFHPPYHILFELQKLPNLNEKLGFLFCTSGGNPGSTLYQMKEILMKKGIKIIDACDKWIGWDVHQMYAKESNSNSHYGWLPSSLDHPNMNELQEARVFGENLIQKCLEENPKEKEDLWKKQNKTARMWSWKGIQKWFPEFHLIEEKCTKCGLCAQICPWNSITLDPFPKWTKDCDRCYICDLKCPENAIKCDFSNQIEFLENLMKVAKKRKS
ncbi:MAG: EFR1 family ferrodoxin [Candidatus Lokiarchaeota archaeon]